MDIILYGSPAYRLSQEIASNYPFLRFPEDWKANINGVDLNLQFPAGWENAKRTYRRDEKYP